MNILLLTGVVAWMLNHWWQLSLKFLENIAFCCVSGGWNMGDTPVHQASSLSEESRKRIFLLALKVWSFTFLLYLKSRIYMHIHPNLNPRTIAVHIHLHLVVSDTKLCLAIDLLFKTYTGAIAVVSLVNQQVPRHSSK